MTHTVMETTSSLRWALYYRILTLASFLVGVGIAAVGLWVGLYDFVAHVAGLSDAYASTDDALAASRPLIGTALVVLGGVIWQVGKTAAFYKTLTEATESQVADQFDTETVKSEILSVMDDRLSDLHADVEATRRQVDRLGQEEHAEAFGVDEADAAATDPSSGDATPTAHSSGDATSTEEDGSTTPDRSARQRPDAQSDGSAPGSQPDR